jgi:hypothetical protein
MFAGLPRELLQSLRAALEALGAYSLFGARLFM